MRLIDRKLSLNPLLSIAVFHACVVRVVYIPGYNTIASVLCAIILCVMLLRVKKIFSEPYLKVNLLLFAMSAVMVVSSLLNSYNMNGTLLFIARLNLLTWFLEIQCSEGRIRSTATVFFLCCVVYLLITYYYIVSDPLMAWRNELNYLVGTKFSVSYLALFGLIMYVIAAGRSIKTIPRAVLFAALCVLALLLALRIDCNTGAIGIVLFMLAIAFKPVLEHPLHKPITYLVTSIFVTFILFAFGEIVLHVGFVSDVITNVFGRSSDLSGRTYVYEHVFPFLVNSPLFGYGYNSVYALFEGVMMFSATGNALDAQNAILEYCLYFGLVGVALLYCYICFVLSRGARHIAEGDDWGRYVSLVGLYVLTILGMAEITINVQFFAYIALYAALSAEEALARDFGYPAPVGRIATIFN